MRSRWGLIVSSLVLAFSGLAGPREGSLCVAPIPEKPDPRSAPGLNCAGRISFRIDSRPITAWPTKESMKVDGLDQNASHRVLVYCDDKPQQSSRFRYSEFKSQKLCLFFNDLYKTVQLWDDQECPWCKCK